MKGRIHSLESFGTVDGPGTRFVVFVQGCPMRCAYCHNPDTWPMDGGTMIEPAEIIEQYEKNRPFYKDGGLTVTGGEPLICSLWQKNGVSTPVSTAPVSPTRKTMPLLSKSWISLCL